MSEKIKLFCISYAGGSSTIYNKWRPIMIENIEVIPVELAGRGVRHDEKFYNNIKESILDIYSIIKEESNFVNIALFGHSMGAMLAYLVAKKIKNEMNIQPKVLFLSGNSPLWKNNTYISDLPDDVFLNKIIEFGGITQEMIKIKELIDMALPVLRADFKMLDEFKKDNVEYPKEVFSVPIIAFTGKYDKGVTSDDMNEWRKYTKGKFELYQFEGNHFFINDHYQEIVDIINTELAN